MQPFYFIGHRGAAGEKFENSMSGFEYALSLDIDAIELDSARFEVGNLRPAEDVIELHGRDSLVAARCPEHGSLRVRRLHRRLAHCPLETHLRIHLAV